MMICPTNSPEHAESGQSGKIIELRSLLAQKFPAAVATSPARTRLSTGVPMLDQCLSGGLPKAAFTEIVCPLPSMGSGTMIHALIEAAHTARKPFALVDAGNSFDPDGLSNAQMARMLWVPCNGPAQAVRVTDDLLRDGNLPLVVLDLMMCPERQVRAVPSSSWYRLQRIVEDSGAVALVFTPTPIVSSAACTLRLTRRFALSSLDLLRDELTATFQMETLRARSAAPVAGAFVPVTHRLSA